MTDYLVCRTREFPIQLAISEAEQEQGLMWKLAPQPMAFPSKSSGVRKFWMKNTPAPLDIIFCHSNQIVEIVRGEPLSLDLVGPDAPTDLVVELPAGMARQCQLEVGNFLKIKYSLASLAKLFAEKIRENSGA